MKTLRKLSDGLEETVFVEKRFEEVAEPCEYRFIDSRGLANCNYHSSSVGYCRGKFCPRLKREGGRKG